MSGSEGRPALPPPPWEARVRQVLKGEIGIDEAVRLPAADRTEGYDPEVFRADLKLLNNLNEVYRKTKSWRLIEFGMSILGGEGRILYLGPESDWTTYAAMADSEGRLITPTELRNIMDEEELLGIDIDVEIEPLDPEVKKVEVTDTGIATETTVEGTEAGTVPVEPPMEPEVALPVRPATIEEGEKSMSTKTLVLGRAAGIPYRKACKAVSDEKGDPQVLTPEEYCEYVHSRCGDLDIRRECRVQLGMDLQTVDEILMRLERSRDPEERTILVRDLMDQDVKAQFVKGQRIYSKAYIEAYPEKFPIEVLSKFNTKIKCESDCLACENFIFTLVKPGPNISRL